MNIETMTVQELTDLLEAIKTELTRRPATPSMPSPPMRVAVDFGGYNERRYSKPWIARITAWPVGGKPEMEFGGYLGNASGGEVEIMARPGDIIRYGQKDFRNPKYTTAYFALVRENGEIETVTAEEARKAYKG